MLWSCRSGLSRSGWGQRSTSPTTSHMMLRALVSGPHREPRGAGQVPEFSFTYVCYKAFHACSQMCILDNLEDDFSWFFTLYTGVAVEQWRFLSEDTWKPSLQRFSGMCLSYQERRKEGKKKRRNKGRRGGRKEERRVVGREGRWEERKEGGKEGVHLLHTLGSHLPAHVVPLVWCLCHLTYRGVPAAAWPHSPDQSYRTRAGPDTD